MKTTAIVEMWDDKTISVYVPEFDGFSLNGQGNTVEEAKQALIEAVNDYKTMLSETGKEVPASLSDIEFDYKYDIASFFECFKFISVSTFAKYAGINPSLMRQYKQRIAFASEAQKSKIEEAIHRAGSEMLAVHL
ncbi:pilus assembly protein HicB [Bacteroides caecigallinarum]|uniref:type II toxin-antitoxin system HicB family antitoxin n=1 Tax=Bacteroides caecigallinarum TaxID=1411144 RepID=UPI001958F5FD|nr:pilus assembly protein HicB [Bacteroides caecigallinarum]MBM6866619.1 pilus assembly protein HicB [Bacteroides caecigallinarum]